MGNPKIVIVGAGVSGLAIFIQLHKLFPDQSRFDLAIYDSHAPDLAHQSQHLSTATQSLQSELTDSIAIVGNNIGLPPQSVELLSYIDNDLYKIFKRRSYSNETYMHNTARGHTIALVPTSSGVEKTVTCPRNSLWRCFQEVVGPKNVSCKTVVDVDFANQRPKVIFSDGEEEEADFVIGADGAKSVIKRAFFEEENGASYPMQYEGFWGMGGSIRADLPETIAKAKSMVFTIGPSGSFGYCAVAPPEQNTVGWWFNWWNLDAPRKNTMDVEKVRELLQDRVGQWKDPMIQQIITKMNTNRVYPIWTTPDLPKWGNSKAVLIGDAAHTVQANSGLGATLALEDGVVFTLLLACYLNKPRNLGFAEAARLASEGLFVIQSPKAKSVKIETRRRFITKSRIRNIFVEYLFYIYVYLWTNISIFSRMVQGGVDTRVSGDLLETQVQDYISKNDLKLLRKD